VPSTDASLGSTSQAAQGIAPSVAGASQAQSSAGSQAAGQSGGADNTSGVDRVRFVQRVANAFQTIGNGDGTLRLRLSPPDLGSLKLEVSMQNGVMSARLEAETPQARDLLVDSLPALRERLNEQNIKVDKFDVDLSGQSTGGLPQRSAQDTGYQQNAPQSGGRQAAGSGSATNAAVSAAASVPAQIISADQLNVVI
jgi:flagellar hook-length control protein FliK